jgi:alpha-mannosidase
MSPSCEDNRGTLRRNNLPTNISHTHWDREWYLPFQTFRLRLVELVNDLLHIMESDPTFAHFTLDGQTIILQDVLEVCPELRPRLAQLVSAGRLSIGPWYVLPDEFLVSPEALIRNLLAGERMARDFGGKLQVGYTPDPFGHIAQLPQILRGFDIPYAVLRRGLADEPCELWWEAPDGSRVFTLYLREGYGNAAHLLTDNPQGFIRQVKVLRDALAPHCATPHLLLMQGTDHMPPQANTPRAIAQAEGMLNGDCLIHSSLMEALSSAHEFVERYNIPIPVVRGELRNPKRHHLLPGVLSTRMWIKQRNRHCEELMEKWVEPSWVWAQLTGKALTEFRWGADPARGSRPAQIRFAWHLLMQNHPHDSICGCSVDQVHHEMSVRFDQVEQIAEELIRRNLTQISRAIDTRHPGSQGAIVVFNPTGEARPEPVTVSLPGFNSNKIMIVDQAGQPLPHYRTEQGEVVLLAGDVPGFGYRTFWIKPGVSPILEAQTDRTWIENDALRATINPEDGTIDLLDKRSQVTLCGLNRFVDGGDAGDEYNYSPPKVDRWVSSAQARVERIEIRVSPACQELEVKLALPVPLSLSSSRERRSRRMTELKITTRTRLYPGLPRLDFHTTVHNTARDHRLRVHFPTPYSVEQAYFDGHFQVNPRPIGLPELGDATWAEDPRPEVPQRVFCDLSDGEHGLMLANRGLPEVAVLPAENGGAEIALTLLRCVGWLSRGDLATRRGHAGPPIPTPGAQMLWTHTFEYTLIPHCGGWDAACHLAYAYASPMRAVVSDIHSGQLPPKERFLSIPESLSSAPSSPAKTSAAGLFEVTISPPHPSLYACGRDLGSFAPNEPTWPSERFPRLKFSPMGASSFRLVGMRW